LDLHVADEPSVEDRDEYLVRAGGVEERTALVDGRETRGDQVSRSISASAASSVASAGRMLMGTVASCRFSPANALRGDVSA
jgi:hypothetical protein